MRTEFAIIFFVTATLFFSIFHELFFIATKSNVVHLASSVGVSGSVLPNEINVLTSQLLEREQAIKGRELAVSEREKTLSQTFGGGAERHLVFFIASFVLILLLLILLNYYLDWRRYQLQSNKSSMEMLNRLTN